MATPAAASASQIRALIVDDEPTARRGVKLMLAQESDVEVVGEAGDGTAAIKAIRKLRPDLVFLDVQMPEKDGFDVIKALKPSELPVTIFITAYDAHALRAFEVNAVDYLLKPFEDERFAEALGRAREQLRSRSNNELNSRITKLLDQLGDADTDESGDTDGGLGDRILIKSSGEIFFLKPEEIEWIEAEGDYMKFHVGGKTHLMRETMGRLEARLDPKRFVRIHRSTIVNLDCVRKLSPSFVGEYAVVLQDGTKLKLSRGYQEKLQSLLKNLI